MNPQTLLAHFDRIADTPDAIPRLRQFILDLAVRGKLVEQDPADEPASELLKRTQAEKARLVQDRAVRKDKPMLALNESEIPFPIPKKWTWSQLAEVGFLNPRNSAEDDSPASFVPMTLISAEFGVANKSESRLWGEIKSGFTHFAEGDVGLVKITPCFENGKSTVFHGLTGGIGAGTTELHIVRPILVSADYVLIFLKSPYFIRTGIPKMTGTAGQKRVSTEYFAYSPFPLPPLAEQHRIVAKVEELMGLCDELETAQGERERQRDKLAAASLQRLNHSDDAPTFRENALFYLNRLPRLTTRPEQIAPLRQTILNLAVRGKLVPQDPADEPASELLKRIQEKKGSLLTKQESLPDIRTDEVGFNAPQNWCWVRLGAITRVVMGHSPPGDTYNKSGRGIPLINGPVEFTEGPFGKTVINQYTTAPTNICEEGDLLICVRGSTTGRTNIAGFRACIGRGVAAIRPIFADQYIRLYIWRLRESIIAMGRGIAFPSISRQQIVELPVPLPPFAEQQRIVAKVDDLMALCDQLETQVADARNQSRRLLEAVLHEALATPPLPGD